MPLPPIPELDLSGPRQRLLERATLAVGRLDSISALLPDPQLFLYAYVRREAVLSSQIEGTQSSLSDLLLFELEEVPGAPFDDVVEVSNYVAALEHGMARLREGFPLSNRLLREMHAVLMSRGRGSDKEPGEFRRQQNWIGGTRPGNARFVPPPPRSGALHGGARTLSARRYRWPARSAEGRARARTVRDHPPVPRRQWPPRAPAHPALLHHGGLLSQPLLYLSLYLKQHRPVYYDLLDRVRTGRLGGMGRLLPRRRGADRPRRRADRAPPRRTLRGRYRRVQADGRAAANALRVLGALRQRPVLTLKYLRVAHTMTFPTASKAMQPLITGIARELTGQRRNRVFVYDAYLASSTKEASRYESSNDAGKVYRIRIGLGRLRPFDGALRDAGIAFGR